jgi:LysM repeat protein
MQFPPFSFKQSTAVCLLTSALFFTGCQTTEIKNEQSAQRADLSRLESRVEQLENDVQMAQSEKEDMKMEVERLKEDLGASQKTNTQYEKDIKRLDDLVKKIDTAREEDRKVIIEEVSTEISRISKKLHETKTPPASDGEKGYEHVVSKGETLTAIAKAYSVSTKAIMEANKLSKSDLKIGQKLFIPKK